MLAQNVVKLDNTLVYDQIEKFLTKHNYNSKGTEVAYRKDIEMFFKLMKNKEIMYLTPEDVQLTLDDFEDFIKLLHDAKNEKGERVYLNKSINRKISAVKGITKYLFGKKIVKDISYLTLIDSLPEEEHRIGVLDVNEVFKMAEIIRTQENGELKRLLLLFCLDTCVRKGAVLKLKWSDFIEEEDGVVVRGVDKGNKYFRHKISSDFYQELLTIKTDNDVVFNISARTVSYMMEYLVDELEIPKERNISFHSVRKAGINYRFRVSGDILEAQRAAGHSNVNTTQIYLQSEDYGAMGAVSSKGNLDMELYTKIDNDVLVQAISMCKKDFQMILNLKIRKILNKSS